MLIECILVRKGRLRSVIVNHPCSQPNRNILYLLQHIEKVFKHKELQQQLMDTKLQRITEMMKEVEEKQQRERDFVSSQ